MYEAARQERTHMLADDTVSIADTETDHQRARNRIDARKWFTSKVNKRTTARPLTAIRRRSNSSWRRANPTPT